MARKRHIRHIAAEDVKSKDESENGNEIKSSDEFGDEYGEEFDKESASDLHQDRQHQ